MEENGNNENNENNLNQPEHKDENKGFFTKNFFIGLGATALGIATAAIGGKLVYDNYTKKKEEKQKFGDSVLEYKDIDENDSIIQKLKNQKNNKPKIIDNSCDNNYIRANSFNKELEEKSDNDKEKEFICPISNKIMEEPVITPYGTTYEKKAILDWIKKNKSDYKTKRLLKENMLVTNYILKEAIKNYKESLSF